MLALCLSPSMVIVYRAKFRTSTTPLVKTLGLDSWLVLLRPLEQEHFCYPFVCVGRYGLELRRQAPEDRDEVSVMATADVMRDIILYVRVCPLNNHGPYSTVVNALCTVVQQYTASVRACYGGSISRTLVFHTSTDHHQYHKEPPPQPVAYGVDGLTFLLYCLGDCVPRSLRCL